jgi:phosphoribosylanthranilate isomerase
MRTRVKICGITQSRDAKLAAELGVDAIGLVFYRKSPRGITPQQAVGIIESTTPFVSIVGLFLNPEPAYVRKVLETVPLDLLQFHGNERSQDCDAYGKPYVKAVPMGVALDELEYTAAYDNAAGFLLDSHAPGGAGGSGATFDWNRKPVKLNKPLILAGGLNDKNVGEAIRKLSPYAVDVSSGVERGKGIKDAAKMAAFIQEVHRVDCKRT